MVRRASVLAVALFVVVVLVRREPVHGVATDWPAFEAAHREDYADFVAFLHERGVADVVPPWHLWRQGTDWEALGYPGFAVPPRELWPAIVPTLVTLREDILPRVGPVEVVSAYRTFRYNQLAGGAPGSRHRWFEAVDVVPRAPWPRTLLHRRLLAWWSTEGADRRAGLGLYERTRFHVDCWKHRKW